MDDLKAPKKLTLIKQLIVDVKTTDTNVTGSIKYDQGDMASTVLFELRCTNFPIGTIVGFTCGSPGPQPPIVLQNTYVSVATVFTEGVMSQIPANFETTITIYASFRQSPPAGASFRLDCYLVEQ